MSTETPSSSLKDRPVALGIVAVALVALVAAFGWAIVEERPESALPAVTSDGDPEAAWSSVFSSDAVAASYGGAALPWSEVEAMLLRLPAGSPEFAGVPDLDTTRQLVRQWLITEALEDELSARGIESDPSHTVEALDQIIAGDPTFDQTSTYGVLAMRTRSLTVTLDRAVERLSAEADIELPEYLCSSHILVETGQEAQEIIALLEDGADFATLAIERSADGSAAGGGDLGCGPTLGYVPEFSDGARDAGNGNLSRPVRSQFGWHVISVRTIGELSVENHPEMDEGQVSQALGSFELQARDLRAQEIRQEIVLAAWGRVTDGEKIDRVIGFWDADRQFIVAPRIAG